MKTIELIGYVSRVPSKRKSQTGNEFIEFGLAVNSKNNEALFVSCILNTDNKVDKFLTKGKEIFIRGPFTLGSYKGVPTLAVTVNELQLLNSVSRGDVVDRKE